MPEKPSYEELEQRVHDLESVESNLKRMQDALRESEAQKQAILDASIDSIRLVDKNMKIIWTNKIIETLINRNRSELVGKYCYEVFTGRNKPCPNCPTEKTMKSGKIEHSIICETDVKGIEGISYWADYAVPVKSATGEITGFIQVSRDINDIKKAEIALREEKNKLENALDKIKRLSGLLPICSICKKIRDDRGYWNQIEAFIESHSEAEFTHSICQECAKKNYPDLDIYDY